MLVFLSSAKGGTGRTVTGCNIAYRLAALGKDVAYVDFDFGSPTAGSVFELPGWERGAGTGGTRDYLRGEIGVPTRVDVYAATNRPALRDSQRAFDRLVLFPGDQGAGDFAQVSGTADLAARLFADLEREFHVCVVDLRSGRSNAVDIVLRALQADPLRERTEPVRWLVFHRMTPQNLHAAHSLIHGPNGILEMAERIGADRAGFIDLIRTVRTAVLDLDTLSGVQTGAKAVWLQTRYENLTTLATELDLGTRRVLGSTPFDHVLQLREQLVLDSDVYKELAEAATAKAFSDLADALVDDRLWEAG